MLRIGRHAIVSFPNFGHWRIRVQVALGGHMPRTRNLPCAWYETPNIHFCTIRISSRSCRMIDARIERGVALDRFGTPLATQRPVDLELVRRARRFPADPQEKIYLLRPYFPPALSIDSTISRQASSASPQRPTSTHLPGSDPCSG